MNRRVALVFLFLVTPFFLFAQKTKVGKDYIYYNIPKHGSVKVITLNSGATNYFVGDIDTVQNEPFDMLVGPAYKFDSLKDFEIRKPEWDHLTINNSRTVFVDIGSPNAKLDVFIFGKLIKKVTISSQLNMVKVLAFSPVGSINDLSFVTTPLFHSKGIDSVFLKIKCRTFLLNHFDVNYLDIRALEASQELKLDSCTLNNVLIDGTTLPPVVTLRHLNLLGLTNPIDFRKVNNTTVVTLRIANIDLTKFIVPLEKFDFVVDTGQSYDQKALLYQQILKQLKDAGLTEKYEVQDKQFQAIKLLYEGHWFINWLTKTWWDYGYDKGRIFLISFLLFATFFVCNVVSLKQLKLVYFPENLLLRKPKN